MLDVYNFCSLYIEDGEEMEIFDNNTCEVVFKGTFRDAMFSDYSDYEVDSFESHMNGEICINISVEADEE